MMMENGDQRTGHVTIDYLERSEDLSLFVIDEDDNETLLVHRICSDDIYRKQEGIVCIISIQIILVDLLFYTEIVFAMCSAVCISVLSAISSSDFIFFIVIVRHTNLLSSCPLI